MTTAGATLPDDVLAARAADGDPRAFETLIRRHERATFATALRITGRRADAEDALQNAFVAVWRRLPEYRGDAQFSTWLFRIVTNHALNQVRSRARFDDRRGGGDVQDLVGGLEPVASTPGPAAGARASELQAALRDVLASLPDDQRLCWVLREVEGRSYEEVAAITGTSVTAVRGRLYRARQRVAADLEAWR